MKTVKLLIVDDHKLIRNGVKLMLSNQSMYDFEFIEAVSGEEVTKLLVIETFDFILLDISLSTKVTGTDILRYIKNKKLNIPVLIQSMHIEAEIIKQSFELGAKGYISKSSEKDELINAIQTIFAGVKYMSNDVNIILSNDIVNNLESRSKTNLTMRQIQILKSIAKGKTNIEIADIFSISVRTVEGHRSRILKKLKLQSTPDLIRYFYDNKLNLF